MTRSTGSLICPHCDSSLLPMRLPEGTGWEDRPQWVCFNDECSYYQDGWNWMWEKYRVKASYRHRVADPNIGHASPLPVWSEDAMRDRIIEQKEWGSTASSPAFSPQSCENPSLRGFDNELQ